MQATTGASVRQARRPVHLGLGLLTLTWLAVIPGTRAAGAVVANAGPDGTMLVGATVALDGSASTGAITQYTWAFTSRPAGSKAVISGPGSVVASFVADRQGTYVVRLTVRDATSVSTDTASFTTQNRPPVANAGSDAAQAVGKKVTLDGRLSNDPDGDKLTYAWTVREAPAHSRRALANPNASRPSLLIDRPGTYVVELVVADGRTTSVPDAVLVTSTNTKPVAAGGRDQRIVPGTPVTLDGSGSYDVDEQPLTHTWTLKRPTKSTAALSDPQSVRPTFVPDVAGSYTATLVVSDGTLTHSDAAALTTANVKPVARVDSGGQGLEAGATVQLDGAGSFDANGNLLSHTWTLTPPAGSAATISDPAAPRPSLTADLAGRYTASLVVRDGAASSAKVNTVFVTGNKAPVADAGHDQSIPVGSVVRLDGAGSNDQNGNELGHGWAFVSKPAGSTATLSATNDAASSAAALSAAGDVRPSFIADQAGTYVLQLIVFDGLALSPADTVVITTGDNLPPTADAGLDRVVAPGVPVTLDGSLSGDADGDILSYAWALVARPAASTAVLTSAATAAPVFTPDVPGDYVVQLIVADAASTSAADTVVVTTANARPVARAGADGSGTLGSPLSLDGTASFDANGDTLTYAWALVSRPPGSTAAPEDPAADTTRFTPDRPGVYVAQLVVRDAVSRSRPDLVAFTVTATTSHRPVARATGPTSVTAGSTVQLDGSTSSDEDGDPLTFTWTFVSLPAGSAAVLQGANTETPTFRADLPGLYVIELVVNDGTEDSLPARVSVNGNAPPVARAGSDQLIAPPVDVQLDGSESFDPEGCGYPSGDPRERDCLTYEWIFNVWPGQADPIPAPQPVLLNPTTAGPSFHAAADGLYVLQLRVGDDRGALSDTDIVRIKTSNAPPLADAGPDQVDVALEAVVGLSGTVSDADGDELSYSWVFVQRPLGSNAVLVDPTSLTPTFVVDVAGRYIVRLEASDGYLIAADTIEIRTPNRGPTANAGPDRLGTINVPITVNGSGSDPDGDPVTYSWVLVSTPGSSVVLSGPNTSSPSFTPDLGGQYTLRLVVNDGFLDSPADDMIVNATSGNLQLELAPPGLLGVGRTRTLRITLTAPAPVGGALVMLSSDNPGVARVSPPSVTVPAGETAGSATVEAVAPGDTVLRASALGYVAATTGISVTAELITLGAGVSAPVGAVSPLPVSIGPAPAPAGGVIVTITTSDPLVLEVLTSTVTIAPGEFSANASVRGVAGGTATVVATSPSHATATTTVTSTGELRILETAVSLSPGIPRSIRVQLQSGGSPIIAPPPGLVVSLAAADPACVAAPATVTIPAGQTLVRQTLAHGGTTPLPCSTTLSATATGLAPGSTAVTVNPTPAITILNAHSFPRLLGAGLQDGGYGARLGTPEHDDVLVRIVSSDPTKLLVSPNATTPGSGQIEVTVPEGQMDAAFYVQGLEEQAGDVTLRVSAPGFADETSGVISVVPPGVSFLNTVPAATTSLSDDTPFLVYIGPALLDESDLVPGIVQAIRAGGLPRTVTVTSSQASVARLRTLGGSTASAAITIPVGSWQTGFSVATGGVALDPVSGGATSVSATIPDFVTTEGASWTVTVTGPGMTINTPSYPYGGVFPRYVGAGLQDGAYWVLLGASSHGGVRVRIESNSPATLLVSADATTPGTPHIEVAVADGQTLANFYVQGLEGQAGDVTVTATAPGFTAETSGTISVVPPGVSLLRSLPAATTRLSQDSPFRVFLGPALPDGSDLYLQQHGPGMSYEQAIRAGGLARQLTLTNSNGPVADLETQAGSGDSVQLTMPEGASSTPHSVDAGGGAFDPTSGGTTTVSASIPGFVTTTAASQEVTVTGAGISVFSPYYFAAFQDFPRRLGAGLQEGPYWVRLEASEHGGVSVRIASNDAGRLLVSPDATTPGEPFIDLPVADGQTDVSFYLQGLEGQSGDATVNVSAPGFTPATSGVVSVVAPGVSLLRSLPDTTTALSADVPFTVSVGPALADGSDLHNQFFIHGPRSASQIKWLALPDEANQVDVAVAEDLFEGSGSEPGSGQTETPVSPPDSAAVSASTITAMSTGEDSEYPLW